MDESKQQQLDLNHDGVRPRYELRKTFESLRHLEMHFGDNVAAAPEELARLSDSTSSGSSTTTGASS
ncbi:hypothetical protein RHSIM_Rhsim12G0031600 [Rhododendron simsii]|uniref:Uncharacterized protein n=1 Tax=Rhododendron simsii TaxID=118357 RepID=A0A834L651_RHOSS|nr:hypothetical protein RHSIM_Rhsim12G0031600 [Rhododendron simsii]